MGRILVLAGVNGAGKSSVLGTALEDAGVPFYNPDRATRRYQKAGLGLEDANSRAWQRGKRQLERAIFEDRNYAFETTLGGSTITRLLLTAVEMKHQIEVLYVGLATPELHIQRVRERVARGGHDISEERIRERWTTSRQNLIRLLPHLHRLSLWDNSQEIGPEAPSTAAPLRVLSVERGSAMIHLPKDRIPGWAMPIIAAALQIYAVRVSPPPPSATG
jgi:predicted ABC-type ATPase